ncbi:MAG: HlyC/CorC family transporter [Planctomycetes bacterium]|nr:HlyC/CorC family transporter [Planctomycetota bacterium]
MQFLTAAPEIGWFSEVVGLLSIPALVALNGFFVMAEFSLVAVRRTRVEELVNRGVTGAKAVTTAIDNLDRTIAATQLGITFASIGLGVVSEIALAHAFVTVFRGLAEPWNVIASHSVAGTLAYLIITFMHVVFGEIIPKTLALQTPDRFSLWVAKPLNLFTKLTRPLIVLINGTGNVVLRLVGYKPATSEGMIHSVEELSLLIEDTEEAGLLEPEQAELVQNVFLLSNKCVRDCMVPRDKMAALELTLPPEKVLEAVRSGAHTRMPVFEGAFDNIVGIVNTKDLFFLFSLRGVVVLEDAMYPPLYLKPDESVANALRLFKKARRPMALVRDDAAKIHGLLTLEDILEEIIGDIEDEHDYPAPKFVRRRTRKPHAKP